MGTSDLPDEHEGEQRPSASAHMKGKSQVPIL